MPKIAQIQMCLLTGQHRKNWLEAGPTFSVVTIMFMCGEIKEWDNNANFSFISVFVFPFSKQNYSF